MLYYQVFSVLFMESFKAMESLVLIYNLIRMRLDIYRSSIAYRHSRALSNNPLPLTYSYILNKGTFLVCITLIAAI